MKLYHSYYDESSKILYGTHESGFYSCINEVRNSLYKLVTNKIYPERISFEHTLKRYRGNEDLYPILYKTNLEQIETLKEHDFSFEYFCPTELSLKDLDYDKVKLVENVYFSPSEIIKNRVLKLEQKYNIDYKHTMAILHRGNDKYREAVLLPFEEWISHIEKTNYDNLKILIQTDEENFKTGFLKTHGFNGFIFEEMLFNNSYVLPHENKVGWCINFEAIMRIISKCKRISTHSGNGGIIPIIYRGNLKEVSQCYKSGRFIDFE